MSDYNSSLPVRTENAGDVVARISDATITSQQLAVDAAGKIGTKLSDGGGTDITSQASGAQRALDVGIAVAGTQIDPRQTRALTSADVVTAAQGTAASSANAWPVKPTDGINSQSYTASGEAKVTVTQPLPSGTNTIGSAKLTDGTNTLAITAANEAKVSVTQPLPAGTNVIGTVNARLDDGAGNAITSATAGSTRPIDAALRDIAGNLYSATNPLPVAFSADPLGAEVDAYNTAAAIAAAATSSHDYTVTSGKTLLLEQIEATASGKMKIEVQIETAAASGVFTTKWVMFNSTANTNMSLHITSPATVVSGARVRIIRTNLDKTAMDVYSTISGQEV